MGPAVFAQLMLKMLDVILVMMEGQPPEVRAELWRVHLKNVLWWQAWFDKAGEALAPPSEAPKS